MAQNEITKVLSNRLEELTERKRDIDYRLSDKKQAEQMGIPYPTFVKYKVDKAECPISTIVKMAEYYSVSTDYLLGRTQTKTPNPELEKFLDIMGLSEKSFENICSITKDGGNANIMLEYDGFKDIIELLNKIKTIAVGQRHYNERIVSDIESNDLLDGLYSNREFQAHSKLLAYIKHATTQIIERQFGDDTAISASGGEISAFYNRLYEEKLVLTEYKLTEHIFRVMINDIKNNTTTDNELFKEFDEQISINLDYLQMNFQSNLDDAPNHYSGHKLDEKKQEIQEDINLLNEFIKYYDEHIRKD